MNSRFDRIRDAMRNAFAIERAEVAEPDAKAREAAERILSEVVRRRLTPAALFLLESGRPLNRVSAATIHFFRPMASLAVDDEALRSFASFLERPGSVEWLCRRLEAIERERPASPDAGSGKASPAEDSASPPESPTGGSGSSVS
jgi:hypothetical protein